MIYGYARVSTVGQANDGNSLPDQTKLILDRYPTAEIVSEAMSGAEERPIFNALIDKLQKGDTLVVTKLDRFCRATKEGLEYIDVLSGKGVLVHILNMGLIEDTPIGRMIVTNLLAYAEFERAMIKERTMAGKAYKKANDPDFKEGRKSIKPENFLEIKKDVDNGLMSIKEAISVMNISRSSWYKYCREA